MSTGVFPSLFGAFGSDPALSNAVTTAGVALGTSRQMQGKFPRLVPRVRVGAGLEQRGGAGGFLVLCRHMQRGPIVPSQRVRVGTGFGQRSDNSRVIGERGRVQRRVFALVLRVQVGTGLEQRSDNSRVIGERGRQM